MKNYYIYGINRVAKDFMYIFDEMNIVGLFDDTIEQKNVYVGDRPILNMEEVIRELDLNSQVIVCDFDKTEKRKKLEEYGLEYGNEFLYEEDFFEYLDEPVLIPNDKKIVLWGIGRYGKKFIDENPNVSIDFCIDSYQNIESFEGIKVIKPDKIIDWKTLFVIVSPRNNVSIIAFLEKRGMVCGTDYILAEEYNSNSANLLRKTIFDTNYYDFECETMLNHLEILGGGATRTCCTTFVDQGIGNMIKEEINDLWGNTTHKILALSVVNRTYSFCNKNMCPFFINRCSGKKKNWGGKYKSIEKNPSVVAIGYDASCNLRCESCREKLYIAQGMERDSVCDISERIEKEIIDKCKFFILAGNGEVFASEAYKKIYTSDALKHTQYIRLLSNGTIFDSVAWETLKKGKEGKIFATFSIDAANPETYEAIRRGGDFTKLKRNMEYAAELRRAGELSYLRLNFVVQKKNYKEMEEFVKWGLRLGVDEVFFTKILNWGTYSKEEFKRISMMEEDGITPKPELARILNKPIMQSNIVDMGTIQCAQNKIEQDYFYNYYMWELERKIPALFE